MPDISTLNAEMQARKRLNEIISREPKRELIQACQNIQANIKKMRREFTQMTLPPSNTSFELFENDTKPVQQFNNKRYEVISLSISYAMFKDSSMLDSRITSWLASSIGMFQREFGPANIEVVSMQIADVACSYNTERTIKAIATLSIEKI